MSKKKIGVFLVLFVAAAAAMLGVSYGLIKNIEVGNIADVEWYDENGKEFTISTAKELYELAKLSDFYNFEGQTIKLGADIVVNEGNAADWAEKAPAKKWQPITGFAGTFDGQKHTISGIYSTGVDVGVGLFTDTMEGCVIRNFRLLNSYFLGYNGKMGTGSIVGEGGGTIQRVYSDVIVEGKAENTGGIIGISNKNTKLEECWFAGSVTGDDRNVGGIAAWVSGLADLTIDNCLNTGTVRCNVKDRGARTAGIIGMVGDTAVGQTTTSRLILSNTLNVGDVSSSHTAYIGSVIGVSYKYGVTDIKNTYTTYESYDKAELAIGSTQGTVTGEAIQHYEKQIEGYGGYQWLNLDFDKYWAVDMESTPILKCFAKEVPDLSGITRGFNLDWYDSSARELVINSKADFWGFAMLSKENDFQSKTVKLGVDVTINEGDASTWGEEAPEWRWYPSPSFSGTFDGQGHTISGLYVIDTKMTGGLFKKTNATSEVRNLRIENSYIEGGEGTGSVMGQGGGTFENIYSNATVRGVKNHASGILGAINQISSVSNCWFDGIVYGEKQYVGGITSGVLTSLCSMSHCLNTGRVEAQVNTAGGLIGVVGLNGSVDLSDSLNVGEIIGTRTGSAIGQILSGSDKVAVNSVFATKESCVQTIGQGSVFGMAIADTKANLTGNGGYQRTSLDFENYWAIVKNGTPILKSYASTVPALPKVARIMVPDTTWYRDSEKTFTIRTAQQLYGFAVLTTRYNFEGKTVKLGADIVFNTGNASDWAEDAPINQWVIGGTFAGTFDGQGHTISGLYYKSVSVSGLDLIGLVSTAEEGAVIKNVSLKNTYFAFDGSGDRVRIGSFAGRSKGATFDTLYSEAILSSIGRGTGGILGDINLGETVVTNSWYNGKLTSTSKANSYAYAGGIVAMIAAGKLTISHCLNSGDLHTNVDNKNYGPRLGGILGSVGGNGTVAIVSDCLNVGPVTSDGAGGQVCALVGRVGNNTEGQTATCTIQNCYAIQDGWKEADGLYRGGFKDTVINKENVNWVQRANALGIGGYQYTSLDFNSYWAAVAGKTPQLLSFTDRSQALNTAGYDRIALVDLSWINDAKGTQNDPYLIKDVSDLYGLAQLVSEGNTFKGKYIKVVNDIAVNTGNASDWAENAPLNTWTPIGTQTSNTSLKPFEGTFDGQGHTISGLYHKSVKTTGLDMLGLFGRTTEAAVIRNVSVKNSYLVYEGTGDRTRTGSFVGRGGGTFENLYSDATLGSIGLGTGGIIGEVNAATKISNCWFEGSVTGTANGNAYAGGIAGYIAAGTLEISHCLNSGSVHSNRVANTGPRIGGILGAATAGTTTISDCLNEGSVTTSGATLRAHDFVGFQDGTGEVTLQNCFAADDSCAYALYEGANIAIQGSVKEVGRNNLLGVKGYQYTILDFDSYWAAVANKTPQLQVFTDKGQMLSTKGVDRMVVANTDWLNEAKGTEDDPYVIADAADLFGLSDLVNGGDTFLNKFFILKDDIAVNTGNASDWANAAPLNVWTPIGRHTSGTDIKPFEGTFDGQGNTISGLYHKIATAPSGTEMLGLFGRTTENATIMNLSVKNSYLVYSTGSDKVRIGSFVGRGGGTFINLYSDATLANIGLGTGGIIGEVNTDTKITDCWFNGSVTGTKTDNNAYAGGIAGYIGSATNTLEISHCLNSGTVHSNRATGTGPRVGGILGSVQNGTAIIDDCLNVGDVTTSGTTTRAHDFIGFQENGSATIKNSFTADDSCAYALYEGANTKTEGRVGEIARADLLGIDGYRYTKLDF